MITVFVWKLTAIHPAKLSYYRETRQAAQVSSSYPTLQPQLPTSLGRKSLFHISEEKLGCCLRIRRLWMGCLPSQWQYMQREKFYQLHECRYRDSRTAP